MRVAICDDEMAICNEIKQKLLDIRPKYSVQIFVSGKELVESEETFDIIFLDIEMPEIDGINTAQLLRDDGRDEHIIFLTSHTEVMREAFKVRAFRFLDKPIEDAEFSKAVFDAENEILNKKTVQIKKRGKTIIINVRDIVYFEAFGDGTYIHTRGNVKFFIMAI